MVNQADLTTGGINLPFNPKPPTVLHIDINSCFATIEQQANPLLRGKPIAVAAYATDFGCVLAPSIEAKRLGIKTGMRVKEAKMICPKLIVLSPDPWKYRNVHLKLRALLENYTNSVTPKSIDEFVLNLENSPYFKKGMINLALEIKQKIKRQIGDWLTVSIGIAPNRFLAKMGAGIHKPDGLDLIDKDNYWDIYSHLTLVELFGIKTRNSIRLNSVGIFTVLDLYQAPLWKIKAAFESITSYYWYLRLRGWEIDNVDFERKSYGNSYALPKALSSPEEIAPILQKLVEKTGARLRKGGYQARGIHLALNFNDYTFWHHGTTFPHFIFDSRDIYKAMYKLLLSAPRGKPVKKIAESVFYLEKSLDLQMSLFENMEKKQNLVKAIDQVNQAWGDFCVKPGRMLLSGNHVLDRIAFGGVKELN